MLHSQIFTKATIKWIFWCTWGQASKCLRVFEFTEILEHHWVFFGIKYDILLAEICLQTSISEPLGDNDYCCFYWSESWQLPETVEATVSKGKLFQQVFIELNQYLRLLSKASFIRVTIPPDLDHFLCSQLNFSEMLHSQIFTKATIKWIFWCTWGQASKCLCVFEFTEILEHHWGFFWYKVWYFIGGKSAYKRRSLNH